MGYGGGSSDIGEGHDAAEGHRNSFNPLVQGSSPWRPTLCRYGVALSCENVGLGPARGGYRRVTGITFANNRANGLRVDPVRKPKGHIRKRPFGYEIAVPLGRDPITKRYLYRYDYAHSEEEAEATRERMLGDMAKGRQRRNEATFGQLLDAVAEVAHLD